MRTYQQKREEATRSGSIYLDSIGKFIPVARVILVAETPSGCAIEVEGRGAAPVYASEDAEYVNRYVAEVRASTTNLEVTPRMEPTPEMKIAGVRRYRAFMRRGGLVSLFGDAEVQDLVAEIYKVMRQTQLGKRVVIVAGPNDGEGIFP